MSKLKKLGAALPADDLLSELDQIQILGGVGSQSGDNIGCNTIAGCNGTTYVQCIVYNNEQCCDGGGHGCDGCACGEGCGCPDGNENCDGGVCCCGDDCPCFCD